MNTNSYDYVGSKGSPYLCVAQITLKLWFNINRKLEYCVKIVINALGDRKDGACLQKYIAI